MKTRIILLLLAFSIAGKAQDTLSLVFVGDAMLHKTQLDNARRKTGYDFSGYFTAVAREITAADVAVVNLEAPLGGAPYTGYPCFSAPDTFALALKGAGFDVFLLANNHCLDKRTKGALRTLAVLDTVGIKYLGVYADSLSRERQYPCLLLKNGFRIALLNYTYGTNGLKPEKPCLVNYMDKKQVAADIEEAKRMCPDMIIAHMHWGTEYRLSPDKEQEAWAAWLFEKGVGIVMGSHPHVVEPMELRPDSLHGRSRLLVYSLGNFVSNMTAPGTDGSALVKVVLAKDSTGTEITSARYSLLYTYRESLPRGQTAYRVVSASAWCDYPGNDTVPALSKLRRYVKATRERLQKQNIGVEEYRFE
ncbi:MAG: CapA family protein [Parabacteroides sp.]|nr:CapA family protein [Parabacteroides sp.]